MRVLLLFGHVTLAGWCVGLGGTMVSLVLEVLILFQQWAGHRLLSEKGTRPSVASSALWFELLASFLGEGERGGGRGWRREGVW